MLLQQGLAHHRPAHAFSRPESTVILPEANGLLGFGMHIASVSDLKVSYQGQPVTVTGTSGLGSDTNFGMNFGAGSEFGLGNVKLYFEVEYVLIFSSGSSTGHIPITVGVTI